MKIAILDMDNPKNPHWGTGQAKATREIASRLAKRHKITVYCSRYPGWKDYRKDGIVYRHIGVGTSSSKLNNFAFPLLLPFTVRKIKADVVVENFVAPISTTCAPLFTNIPVVGYPTTFDAQEFTKKYHVPFHWVERFGCRYYRYFMPYAKYQQDKMKALNPNVTSRIIPEGVDASYFSLRRKKATHILFIGRFDVNQKGIDLLLKAYAQVKQKIGLPLVIAGYGPDEQEVKKLVSSLKLENDVQLVGGVFGAKKDDLLEHARYVAFPSRFEGFSVFALEAFASGLPIVAFDIPAMEWAPKEACFKAKPFSVTAFAKKLVEACQPQRNAAMSKAARKLAKNYSWDDVADRIERFLQDVVRIEHDRLALVQTSQPTNTSAVRKVV